MHTNGEHWPKKGDEADNFQNNIKYCWIIEKLEELTMCLPAYALTSRKVQKLLRDLYWYLFTEWTHDKWQTI